MRGVDAYQILIITEEYNKKLEQWVSERGVLPTTWEKVELIGECMRKYIDGIF